MPDLTSLAAVVTGLNDERGKYDVCELGGIAQDKAEHKLVTGRLNLPNWGKNYS